MSVKFRHWECPLLAKSGLLTINLWIELYSNPHLNLVPQDVFSDHQIG